MAFRVMGTVFCKTLIKTVKLKGVPFPNQQRKEVKNKLNLVEVLSDIGVEPYSKRLEPTYFDNATAPTCLSHMIRFLRMPPLVAFEE
jgi:hypothetical protein